MMSKQIAIIGDMTTTGGRIISGSGDSFNANQSIALLHVLNAKAQEKL